jgi:threonine dehydrogenase-like Zn-dependent dehydrogenase
MLAAFYRENGRLHLEDIPIPEPAENEVQVEVQVNTICGSTDRKIISGLRSSAFEKDVILGHEAGGIVVKVGKLVTDFQIGDRVACEAWGTYTKYLCTTPDLIQHVPDNLSWDEIALAEITMKVYQMIAGQVLPGDTVIILGQGASGLLFTQMARLMGASRIIVSDLYDFKLETAKEFGAHHVINAQTEDVIKKALAYTDGKGADVVIEAAGVPETVMTAPYVAHTARYRAKGYGSKILQFGVVPQHVTYDFARTHDYGQTILTIGSCRFIEEDLPFRRAIQLISERRIQLDSFITHRFPLNEINQAFDVIKHQPETVIKIAIDPMPETF